MEARLQRRIQRYGWDRAAVDYEALWAASLAPPQRALLALAALRPGERVLDLACGSGLLSQQAARAVGPQGQVLGSDISERMVEVASANAARAGLTNLRFERGEMERVPQPDASADAVLCALGLMYTPSPEAALAEMVRVLRPGGRLAVAVWGERAHCGWAPVLGIVDDEVASEVCPLFFRLGPGDALARALAAAGLRGIEWRRQCVTLDHADERQACDAALVGGPVALAWSRFDAAQRQRVQARYLQAIAPWRAGVGYRVPGEFVIGAGYKPLHE